MIRVLIADDHAILRRGLEEILVRELEGAVCGEAENAQQVFAQVQNHSWDLVILDLSMPGRSGLDVLRDLKRTRPKVPVLMLSMHPEDQYGKRVLRAGASGYMNKESAPEELIKAIWPNVVVTDESLTHCISEVRQAIGDRKQTIIATVPRRGPFYTRSG